MYLERVEPGYVFPAYAGMIRLAHRSSRTPRRVPRLRGDDPLVADALAVLVPCSPPTRG